MFKRQEKYNLPGLPLLPFLQTRKISGCGSRASFPGSFRRCLSIAVIPRAWTVGTKRKRVDVWMDSKSHDKFTFSSYVISKRERFCHNFLFFVSLTVLFIPQTVNYLPSHFTLESPSVSQIPSLFFRVVLPIQINYILYQFFSVGFYFFKTTASILDLGRKRN